MRCKNMLAVGLAVITLAGLAYRLGARAQPSDADDYDESADFLSQDITPPCLQCVRGYQVVEVKKALPEVTASPKFPSADARANCPTGKKVLGGGCLTSNGEWLLSASTPSNLNGSGWWCRVTAMGNAMSGSGQAGTAVAELTAYALCGVTQ